MMLLKTMRVTPALIEEPLTMTRYHRLLVTLLLALPLHGLRASDAGPSKPSIDGLWTDMASDDEPRALRALLALTATPDNVVPFLKKTLKPVMVDRQRMERWLADLGSTQFAVRQRATEELLYVGEYADPFLRKALEEKPSLEERRRIEQILEKVSLAKQPDDWPRTARALALLEHFGTPEAKHVLEQLAKGRAKAPITQGAEAALDRLEVQLRWPIADRMQAMRRGEPVLVARTILALTATPQSTLEHLQEATVGIPPAPPIFAKRIAHLAGKLDEGSGATELLQLGIMARPALHEALTQQPPKKARRLLEGMLMNLEQGWFFVGRPPVPYSPFRVRLGVVLQYIDTQKARELDDALGRGKAIYEPTSNVVPRWFISPDGKHLATVGARVGLDLPYHSTVFMWDASTAQEEWWAHRRNAKVIGVRFTKDSKTALVDFADLLTDVYDMETGKITGQFLRQDP